MLERYLIPIAPYLLLTAGLAVCAYIFYSLNEEIRRLKSRLKERDTQLDTVSQNVLVQIDEMRAELREAEERTGQLVPPAPSRSGLNLNTKTQVIRMFRHGADEGDIASKLCLPRNEVRLLLKVHRMAVDRPPMSAASGVQALTATAT